LRLRAGQKKMRAGAGETKATGVLYGLWAGRKSPRMRDEAYFFLDLLLTIFLFFKVFASSSRKAGFGWVLFYQEKRTKKY
jgi:hypothetical protein